MQNSIGILLRPSTTGGATPFENTKSLLFDGSDDYVSTGYSYDATVTPNFSMSFWIKTTSTALFKFPVAMQTGGGNYTNAVAMIYGTQLLINDRTGWNFGTNTSINNGNWHNIIVTASYSGNTTSGTSLNMYLDGNLTPDLTSATMGTGTNSYLSGDLYMGSYDGAGEFFNGNVDEVAVWQRILSSADITAIYNSGVPDDLTSLNPVGYWRNGDGDTYPTIIDHGSGGNNGAMQNMTSGDIVTDVP